MKINLDKKGFYVDDLFFFPLGFNYWPRDMAVYLWEDYNSVVIEREMKIISQLGANCIRMFIRWEDLNPIMGKVDESLFSKFDDFIQYAKKYDIKLIPTLLIGHMSGQDWFPQWLLLSEEDKERIDVKIQIIGKLPEGKEECLIRDIYTDKQAVENSKLQLKVLLERYKNNKTILSWDISNENQYWMEPKTPKIGTEYVKNMVKFMKSIDPNHPITYGMGKPDEPSGFISFGRRGFAQYLDYYSVHVYPEWLYPMSSQIIDFYVSYRIAYECCLGKLSHKSVQLQEFGLSDMFFPLMDKSKRDKIIYGYFNIAFWDVILNNIRGGILTWDFCDFVQEMKNRHPYDHKEFELYFGAFDNNYQIKPGGKALQKFSKFIQEYDISRFSTEKSDIGVILPEKYNDFPPVKNKKDILEENTLNHSKSLFSSFIFCKMCHKNLDFVSLDQPFSELKNYSMLIFPNIYNLTQKFTQKLLKYISSGKNRTIYISSNTYLPENIFGIKSWNSKTVRKGKADLNLENNELSSVFRRKILLKKLKTQIELQEKNDSIIPIYNDNNNNSVLFYKKFQNNNKAIFSCVSPEINHTQVKKSYQNESGASIYHSIFKWVDLESKFDCNNPLVETSILLNENSDDALLICINHEFSSQECTIDLRAKWDNISEYYGLKFQKEKNSLKVKLPGFEAAIFILRNSNS